jgi:hypothetical protein
MDKDILKMYFNGKLDSNTEPLGSCMVDFYLDILNAEMSKYIQLLDILSTDMELNDYILEWYERGHFLSDKKNSYFLDSFNNTIEFIGLCKRVLFNGDVIRTPIGMVSPFYETFISIQKNETLNLYLYNSCIESSISIGKENYLDIEDKNISFYFSRHFENDRYKIESLKDVFLAKVI